MIKDTSGIDLVDTTDLAAKEDNLGNPVSNGYILSSTTAGVRSWQPLPRNIFTSKTNTQVYSSPGSDSILSNSVMPLNTLPTNGSWFDVKYIGTTAPNANNKTIQVKFDGTIIAQNTVTSAPNGLDFCIKVSCLRLSNTVLKCFSEIEFNGVLVQQSYQEISALNLSGSSYDLDLVANAVSTADITMYFAVGNKNEF